MANLVYRKSSLPVGNDYTTTKGAPLTNDELDNNLFGINAEVQTKADSNNSLLTGLTSIENIAAAGGSINNTTIGATTRSTGAFTTLLVGDLLPNTITTTVNNDSITTTGTTFNLVNATATTLNLGGAATAVTIGALTGTATIRNATLAITGSIAVNTDKFTVASGSGNTVVAGTLGVSSAATLNSLTVTNAASVGTTLSVVSDVAFGPLLTPRFTVAGSTGNTTISGTLGVVGASIFSNNLTLSGSTVAATEYFRITDGDTSPITKFLVDSSNGNTTISGTLGVSGASIFSNNLTLSGSNVAATEYFRITDGAGSPVTKFLVDSSSGDTTISGTLGVVGASIFSNNLTLSGSTVAATEFFRITDGAGSPVTKFLVDSSSGDTTISGTLGVTGALGVTGITTLAAVNATTGSFSGQITSTVADGTMPFVVSSTTKVNNLNADRVDDFSADQANTASTIVVRNSSKNININNVVMSGSTSGTTTLQPTAAASGTLTLPAATDTLVGKATTDTLTNKTLTSPTINGGTHSAITTLGIRDTSAAFDVTIAASSSTALTAGRTLTLDMVNAARTVKLAGNISLAGNFTTSGAFGVTLTATALTSVTLPITGILATVGGTEELTNKTLTSPAINTATIVGGTINNTVIGGTTAAPGAFTTLSSTGEVSGSTLKSTVATGTAPLTVSSTTRVSGLNSDRVDDISFTTSGIVAGGIPYVESTSTNNHVINFSSGSSGTVLYSSGTGAPTWILPSNFSAGSSYAAQNLKNSTGNGDTYFQSSFTTNLTTTIGSTTATVSNNSNIFPGMLISGNSNIPTDADSADARVVSRSEIDSTIITLTVAATASGTVSTTFYRTNALTIGAANSILTSSGTSPQWSTALSLAGTLNVSGATTLSSTLSAGASTLNSLTVTNGASVGSTFSTGGASTLNSLIVTNTATVGTTLVVTGATTLSSTLSAGASTLNSLGVTNNASIGGTLLVSNAATLSSTLTHSGLTPSAGTNVDQLYTATDSGLIVTTEWVDTSVNATELANGSYMVQVSTGSGATLEFHTGIMSWFAGDANTASGDEIVLHRASAGSDVSNLFLRVYRSAVTTTDMVLQISASSSRASAAYTYKFRRMI